MPPPQAKRDGISKAESHRHRRGWVHGHARRAAVVPMASWLLLPLPSFPWLPPPPPPGSSSGGRGGGGGGGDGGDWRPNVVAAFAGAQVGSALRRRFAGLLCSPEVRHLEALPKMDDGCFGGFATHSILGLLGNMFPASYVCSFALSSGNGSFGSGTYIGKGKVLSRRPRRIDSKKRFWTNVLLAINVLTYIAQVASQGKLLMWGAKINSLIDRGQFWRLATSSLLHANVTHLAVGAYAVYMWRHRSYFGNARESLEHIGRVVVLNMGMGLLSRGIDNWGHLGGLLGGVAVAWLLGPAWQYQYVAKDGRVVFKDRAPVLRLIKG
ncbi:hypothetical protein PAHAL_2G287500 [Panicum hallii]|uniref:Peptidase S54 rhomboid domain-containing protein n=1 Tax=Panicum hallii TaxID=206008 RepID=A0A2S3H013_9POAL|nr:hypothetical protein PAHAL_2G287500 [Panicum hallii]